jgi:hypothetical protein
MSRLEGQDIDMAHLLADDAGMTVYIGSPPMF